MTESELTRAYDRYVDACELVNKMYLSYADWLRLYQPN